MVGGICSEYCECFALDVGMPQSPRLYGTVQNNTVQYSTVQYSTVQYSTVQYSTVQYSTVQYSTVQYSTVQYSTVQYSTVQYSTVQYSTVQYTGRNIINYQIISPSWKTIPDWLIMEAITEEKQLREVKKKKKKKKNDGLSPTYLKTPPCPPLMWTMFFFHPCFIVLFQYLDIFFYIKSKKKYVKSGLGPKLPPPLWI